MESALKIACNDMETMHGQLSKIGTAARLFQNLRAYVIHGIDAKL